MFQGAKFKLFRKLLIFIYKILLLAGKSFCLPMQDFYYPSCVSIFYSFITFTKQIPACQISIQCLGAAVAVAVSSVPAWEQGYTGGNVGGLLEAMLSPLGNFGKFLTVLLSLSVAGNNVVAFYSISINLQVFLPVLAAVPRYVFSVVATAM